MTGPRSAAAALPRNPLAGQALRYALCGALLAGLYSVCYWWLARHRVLSPQGANAAAFLVNLVAGWLLHSQVSFRGYGLPGRPWAARLQFAGVNLAGYGLNALWVWLVVERLDRPPGWAIVPIVTATPVVTFILNRLIIFRIRL